MRKMLQTSKDGNHTYVEMVYPAEHKSQSRIQGNKQPLH